jgi:molybdopterin/thiamine biosynthesis adenylyltransferase
MGIFNVEHLSVCLIGAGGIGALTAIALAKMGVGSMMIYDSDKVDEVNIATQFYRVEDIGKSKAVATDQQVMAYADRPVLYSHEYVDEKLPKTHFSHGANVYISAVDSIKSRKGIWETLNKRLLVPNTYSLWDRWYIDARMGAEQFEMFVVRLDKPMWYEDHIRKADDSDYPDLPCTSKATIYTAAIAAGHIGAAVRRIATLDQIPGFLSHDIVGNELYYQEMEA